MLLQSNNLNGISIHAARVGCDRYRVTLHLTVWISIHAARVGCDKNVNSTYITDIISIHAARVGCDSTVPKEFTSWLYFNPRSPSGLRLLPMAFVLYGG